MVPDRSPWATWVSSSRISACRSGGLGGGEIGLVESLMRAAYPPWLRRATGQRVKARPAVSQGLEHAAQQHGDLPGDHEPDERGGLQGRGQEHHGRHRPAVQPRSGRPGGPARSCSPSCTCPACRPSGPRSCAARSGRQPHLDRGPRLAGPGQRAAHRQPAGPRPIQLLAGLLRIPGPIVADLVTLGTDRHPTPSTAQTCGSAEC